MGGSYPHVNRVTTIKVAILAKLINYLGKYK